MRLATKRKRNWVRFECKLTLVLSGIAVSATSAPPPQGTLAEAVPADIVAAFFTAGPEHTDAEKKPWSALDLVQPLATQAQQFGILSLVGTEVRVWVDALASLSLVQEYPHAVVLFDIHAHSLADGGHRLKDLRAALVISALPENKSIEQRIQHLLTTYTNKEETALKRQSINGAEVFTLRDRRLPNWLSFSWGRLGGYYVVALGDGAFERIAKTVSLRVDSVADDPWFKSALSKMEEVPSDFVLYARLDRLRSGFGDSLRKKTSDVLAALRLERMQRGLLTLGVKERSVEVAGIIRRDGKDQTRRLISRTFHTTLSQAAVPKEARRYSLVDAHLGPALKGLTEAVWSARSAHARRKEEAFWYGIDRETGVSLEQDIYGQLGGPLLLHDYPPHPLGLSFAWNLLVPIEGNADKLRKNLDRWLGGVQRILLRGNGIKLQRTESGLWYTQFGLVGPAVTVTDRWLVLGFSPEMVRQVRSIVDAR